ncbi:hypothetical protein [Pedobacter sp. N23S346]|uniref:hypothetical protein n=1 Tax=Pedobacter sp. N23S346 TaxID=3402750 RepID=UPI003ABF8DDE
MKEYLLENPQVVVTLILGITTLFVTFWFNTVNLKINRQKMEKDLFSEFNKRYDDLNDSLTKLEGIETIEQLKATSSKIENKTMYIVLIDYFNLCAEQYYWKKQKKFSTQIWSAWQSGMQFYFDTYPVVMKLWVDQTKNHNYKSFYLKENIKFWMDSKNG